MTKKTLLTLSCAGALLLGGGVVFMCTDMTGGIVGVSADPFPLLNEGNFAEYMAGSRMNDLYKKFETLKSRGLKAAEMKKQGGAIIDELMDWDRKNTPFSPKEKKLRDMFIAKLIAAGAKPNLFSLRAADNEELGKLMLENSDILSNLNVQGYEKEHWGHMVRFNDALADCQSLVVAKFLVKNGANTDIPLEDFSSEAVAEYMKSKGCKVKNASLRTCGTVVAAKTIIKKGMNLNGKDRAGNTLLHLHYRNPGFVKLLLQYGADSHITDNEGRTALDLAVKDGVPGSVELLLKQGVDVNAKDKGGATLLYRAVENNQTDVARLLLEKGANINEPCIRKRTALHVAAENGNPECVTLLMEKGADAELGDAKNIKPLALARQSGNKVCIELLRASEDKAMDMTPLHRAAEDGDVDEIRRLLASGMDVNAKNKEGWTPVRIATSKKHQEAVKLLLEKGADPNADVGRWTSLHIAACDGNLPLLKVLVEKGGDIDFRDRNGRRPLEVAKQYNRRDTIAYLQGLEDKKTNLTPLHRAAREGDLEKVKQLHQAGADLNAATTDESHSSALTSAAYHGHLEVVRYLLDAGADIHHNADGWQAIHAAAWYGHYEIVRLLLERGASVNNRDKYGRTPADIGRCRSDERVRDLLNAAEDKQYNVTPLHRAAEAGDLEEARRLVKEGADLNAIDRKNNATPLQRATAKGHIEVVRCLLEAGADVNAGKDGWTPLHAAARHNHAEIAKLLLEHGADVTKRDVRGSTPLDVARKRQSTATLEILKAAADKADNITPCTAPPAMAI